MGKVALPKLAPSKESFVRLAKPAPEIAEAKQVTRKLAHVVREQARNITVPSELAAPHPLVKAAEKRLKQRDGWTNDSGLRSAPSEVINIEVTRLSLDRALLIADTLLKELGKRGITANIDAQKSITLLDIEGIFVSFSLTEHVSRSPHIETPSETRARKRYWSRAAWDTSMKSPAIPQFDYQPTGILKITANHWPSRSWKDTDRTTLERRLSEVIAGIYKLASEIRTKNEAEARRQEARRIATEQYVFLVQRYEDELSKFKALEFGAENWKKANQLREYINAVERHAIANGGLTPEKVIWLEWARAKADWIDPLISVCDPILDAPKPKKPGYW